MNFDAYLKEAQEKDKKALKKNGGKNYVGSASASYAKPTKSKVTKSKAKTKVNNNKGTNKKPKPTGSRKQLTKEVKDDLQKAQGTYAVPKFMRNASEALIDNSIGGTVYAIAKGKKLSDSNKSKYYKEQHSGTSADIGKMFGQGVAFASQMAFGSPATSKAAKAVAGTKLGKSLATKVGTTTLGKKLGKKGAQSLVQGATKGLIEDTTIGLGQNIGMARAEGLKGKDLAKDVALNTGADILLGGAIESAPFISNAVKNTKLYKNAESRRALREGIGSMGGETRLGGVEHTPIDRTYVHDASKTPKSTSTPTKPIEPNNLSTNAENTLKAKAVESNFEEPHASFQNPPINKQAKDGLDEFKEKAGISHFGDEEKARKIFNEVKEKADNGTLTRQDAIEACTDLLMDAKTYKIMPDGRKAEAVFIEERYKEIDNDYDIFGKILNGQPLNQVEIEPTNKVTVEPTNKVAPEIKPTPAKKLPTKTKIKEVKKNFKTEFKNRNGIAKFDDNKKANEILDRISGKAAMGRLSDAEKDEAFETLMDMAEIDMGTGDDLLSEIKATIRKTPIKLNDHIRKNIVDYNDFRKSNFGKLRLSKEGVSVDSFYMELQEMYPGYFPDLNTTEEMIEYLAKVASKENKQFYRVSELEDEFYDYAREIYEEEIAKASGRELKPNGADVLQERQSMKEIREKYGTMDDGKTPKATQMGKVSQTAKTISNSPLMDSPERQKLLDEAIKDGDYWKPTISNKKAFERAEENIASDIEKTTDNFFAKARTGGQTKSVDIFTGYQLAKKYMDEGDYDMAESILAETAQMVSESGRTLQAMRIFNSLSPEGRVKSVLKMADKIGLERDVDIKVPEELLDKLYHAFSETDIAKARKEIATNVWNQVPATFMEKVNAFRYLAMLGNIRTHIRNILGNMAYLPARIISDSLATVGESLGKNIDTKTKAIVGFTGDDKALRTKAKEEFKEAYEMMSGSGKFNEQMRDFDAKVFDNKALEKFRKANGDLLELEDKFFMGINFESVFVQYCKANGKKAADLTDDFIKEASLYAGQQALKSTYRDFSKLANSLNKFKKAAKITKDDDFVTKIGKAGVNLMMESAIPFRKTPINILKRGVEYSPIGLMNGLYKVCSAKDGYALVNGIESLAQGITGTGLVALGMWAANKGYVNGSLGDYDTETQYKQMLGSQNYALNVGDKSITLDWAAPLSMPFFVGVEAAKGMEDFDIYKAIESLESIAEPVFEMSMLSGVDNVFNTAFSDSNSVVEVFKNSVENYLSQFVPTLAGQIARTATKDRRITLSTAETDTQRRLEKTGQKLANKIPGLTDLNQPYVDMWGRTDSKKNSKDYLEEGLENFLSPAYISNKNITPVDKELLKLGEKTGNLKELLPTNHNNQYEITFNKQKYRLTESQLTQYKKTRGKEAYSQLNKLINSKEYKNMTTSEKTKAIKGVYSDATDKAVKEYLLNSKRVTPESYARSTLSKAEIKNTQKSGASVLKVAEAKEVLSGKDALEKAYYGGEKYDKKTLKGLGVTDKAIEQAKILKENDISLKTYQNYVKKADKDKNGNANQDETKAYFEKSNLTRSQKAYLWKASGWVDSRNPYL